MTFYKDTSQISETTEYVKKYPAYGKSTTDPTYYEPAATRIANMRRSSGVLMEGIYDFYTKDDVSKFDSKNFAKNIGDAIVDPTFIKGLTREEVSQVTQSYIQKTEDMLDKKAEKSKAKKERINESIETQKAINNTIQTDDTVE